jgi:hypothetical protein
MNTAVQGLILLGIAVFLIWDITRSLPGKHTADLGKSQEAAPIRAMPEASLVRLLPSRKMAMRWGPICLFGFSVFRFSLFGRFDVSAMEFFRQYR